MVSLNQTLLFIGGAIVLKNIYRFISFLRFHLSASTVHRYLHGNAPYALITGATDGIGKSTAKELYKRGFSIILHGRNPEKLHQVEKELKQLGSRDVRIWVEDASRSDIDFEKAVAQWDGLNITLMVHNVGGTTVRLERTDEVSEKTLMDDVRRNATFPLLLSRAILPKLRSASGPAGMVFIGSLSAKLDLPRVVPYAATKSFIVRLSRSFGMDERFWAPTNVETSAVIIANVVTNINPLGEGFFNPTADRFAPAMVDRFGCGRAEVVPYWPHALQIWALGLMPQWLFEKTVVKVIEENLKGKTEKQA